MVLYHGALPLDLLEFYWVKRRCSFDAASIRAVVGTFGECLSGMS